MDHTIGCWIDSIKKLWGDLMSVDKLELKLEQLAEGADKLLQDASKAFTFILDQVLSILSQITILIHTSTNSIGKIVDNPFFKLVRYLTFPSHFIWIIAYLLLRLHKEDTLLYDKPGVHIIVGPPGCGKSSLMYMLAERLREKTGKPALINSDLEKPRLSEEGGYKFKYHMVYNFTQFWRDRKMVEMPNHHIASSLHIDEGHRILNYRENGSTEYNDKFKPFMDYAVLVRKYIGKIYFSTQMGKVDIQLMHLAQSLTQPRVDIGFDYPDWIKETGAFRFRIKGFYIDQYSIDAMGEKSAKPIKSFYIRNEWADFDYFETMAMNDVYDHVRLYKPDNMIKERVNNYGK